MLASFVWCGLKTMRGVVTYHFYAKLAITSVFFEKINAHHFFKKKKMNFEYITPKHGYLEISILDTF